MNVYSRRAVDQTATRAAFTAFLVAPSSDAAREALGILLDRHLAPLVRSIVETRLRREQAVREGADAADVVAGVLLRLTERLGAERLAPGVDRIADVEAYAASAAHNACHAFLRRRYPERARLRARLRYLLTHDGTLAVWSDAGGEWLCGTARRRGAALAPDAASWLAGARTRARAEPGAAGFAVLVRSLLRSCPGACRVEDVVDALAFVLGVEDGPGAGAASDTLAAFGPSPADAVQQKQWLGRLWQEVRQLPRPQRVALLLNLRDGDHRGGLGLLPLTGTASREDIAEVLEIPPADLIASWDGLPRDDAWIASFLGVTPRQVINLRKAARERLARRMRAAGAAVTSTRARALNLGGVAAAGRTESKR